MNNSKLLTDLMISLRTLAENIQKIADAIDKIETDKDPKPIKEKQEKTSKEKEITLEEVRALLAEKSHDGFTAEVRGLLEKYGGSKLSEIDSNKYTGLLKDAEELK